MRRSRLRFDLTTLLAGLLAGLLPACLLVIMSYFYMEGLSLPLLHKVQEPHNQRVREGVVLLDEQVELHLGYLEAQLRAALQAHPEKEGGGPSVGIAEDAASMVTQSDNTFILGAGGAGGLAGGATGTPGTDGEAANTKKLP